jgi:hypothetical protein
VRLNAKVLSTRYLTAFEIPSADACFSFSLALHKFDYKLNLYNLCPVMDFSDRDYWLAAYAVLEQHETEQKFVRP